MQANWSRPALTRQLSIGRIGGNRLVIGAAATAVIAAATAWQWSWLVAIGVAPLLLSVAPCVAMCGLGLCMRGVGGRACGSPSEGRQLNQNVLEAPSTTQEV